MKFDYSNKILKAFLLKKNKVLDTFKSPIYRRKLKNKNFSIICNDCLASMAIYKKFEIEYLTPTVGTLFFPEDFISFLESIENKIAEKLTFKNESKYEIVNKIRNENPYPVGVLEGDIEIHFFHYKSKLDALQKWNRRTKRINLNNLFVIFSDRFGINEDQLNRYSALPYRKIFFSHIKRQYDFSIYVPGYIGKNWLSGSAVNRKFEKYFDTIKWLNNENDYLKSKT